MANKNNLIVKGDITTQTGLMGDSGQGLRNKNMYNVDLHINYMYDVNCHLKHN